MGAMLEPGHASEVTSAILDALPVGIWVARVPDAELIYVNEVATRIIGVDPHLKPEGGISRALRIFRTTGEPLADAELPFFRAIELRDTYSNEYLVRRADG